ncbi:unnamed protein product [Rotaria socialis]|uniref:EF-hand domain-containing protein n=1 Tax=Rotaria socialis TaxID=392032 RepID=A0A817RDP8_9BILA|nr:unnamed protein product [Rotaria socialis]CAF3360652.1 unnamed protein product [Rotaria socialis]CAF3381111.1 unnamed protein product [Rotaria socialis]CAF3757399.1 unnamed protein product [Rotaria socialis]CAF3767320.1 unnamed protein product [Rotaria socialis]
MGNHLHKQYKIYQILTDDTLAHCHAVTKFSDDEIRAEHEKFFRITGNGCLKKSHMEELLGDYVPLGKHKNIKYLTKCIFSTIDTNNDGYIDFLEYLISIKFFKTKSPIEKANFMFRILDKNGDKHVTLKEIEPLLKCLEEYHKSSSNTHVTNMMNDGAKSAACAVLAKLDENNSGDIGVSEFVDGWLKDETIRALFTFQ